VSSVNCWCRRHPLRCLSKSSRVDLTAPLTLSPVAMLMAEIVTWMSGRPSCCDLTECVSVCSCHGRCTYRSSVAAWWCYLWLLLGSRRWYQPAAIYASLSLSSHITAYVLILDIVVITSSGSRAAVFLPRRPRYYYGKSSVCLSVRDVEVSWSHRSEYFNNNSTVSQPWVFAVCRHQQHWSSGMETPQNLAGITVRYGKVAFGIQKL